MIYCFDLDGTLCDNPLGNFYEDATPKKGRIAYVNTLYDAGHTIIIDSARGVVSGKNWNKFTRKQLESWGVKYHQLRTGVKFNADIFVGDRMISDRKFFILGD